MCDGAPLAPRLLPWVLLLLVRGLEPGTAVPGRAAVELAVPRWVGPDSPPLPGPPGPPRQHRRPRAAPRALLLHLPAFGRDLYLQLRRDLRFLAPGFQVEEAGAESRRGRPAELCIYSGRVLGHAGSLASLSACGANGGLVGLIQLGQEQVFIQPLNSSWGSRHTGEHVIRRRWSWAPKPCCRDWSIGATLPSACSPRVPERPCLPEEPQQRRRERRDAIRPPSEHALETLVVADANMVHYHGAEAAQRFLLTVMNMVYNMFQHQSLGVKVSIRVTRLVLLHQRPLGSAWDPSKAQYHGLPALSQFGVTLTSFQTELSISHHGERSLESFCQWQNEEYGGSRYLGNNQVPGGKDDVPPVDAAVFVTRTDFCVHKDEPCDTVGIAYLGGACSAKRKCLLAEDNGLNLAFTIAHELGHNLGMNHDDQHSPCSSRSHIMSGEWVKGRSPSDLSWSSCSRDDLETFLKSKTSSCLQVTGSANPVLRLPHKLPGLHYSADGQCQILFGTNASFCRNMEHLMCAGLWCLVEGDTSCKTKLDPPLDGTECGPDKWCRAGECVSKTPLPDHEDGDWSPWSAWSLCSRTCGTGARFRQRKCDHPPPGPRGLPCLGASVEHAVCEHPPCPPGLPSFRDQQCQTQDWLSGKTKHLLTAVVVDESPCALFCLPLGTEAPLLVSERVLDGTSCGPYETDLCVHGHCQKIGCDGIIGSTAKEDRCGVCSGDGASCRVVKRDFSHPRGTGYIEAAVIPVGARRIRVVENQPAHGFLALRDSSRRSINSDWKIALPGEFQIAGTTVRYVRRGLWEKISAKGPTEQPLHLMAPPPHEERLTVLRIQVLLFHDQSYGIHYEYIVPVSPKAGEGEKAPDSAFLWTHSGWEDCSVQCGGGQRRTIVSCTRVVNQTTALTSDSNCPQASRPEPQVRRCNSHPCQSWWAAGPWSPCSASCERGTQHREVTCVSQLQNGTHAVTQPLYCPGPPPAPVQSCEGHACLSVWEASEWSQCSTNCGVGTQQRNVTCANPQGRCDPSAQPPAEKPCEDNSGCYEWKTGEWAKCSASCGKGLQSRVVQCMHRVSGRHGHVCPALAKPTAYRQCQREACGQGAQSNTITSPRLAALTYKCTRDQWTVHCRVIREQGLCSDPRWYQRCCQTCRDFYASRQRLHSPDSD